VGAGTGAEKGSRERKNGKSDRWGTEKRREEIRGPQLKNFPIKGCEKASLVEKETRGAWSALAEMFCARGVAGKNGRGGVVVGLVGLSEGRIWSSRATTHEVWVWTLMVALCVEVH